MTIISSLQLRNNLSEVIDAVHNGEEVIVTYRNNKSIKLVPNETANKSKTESIFTYFESKKSSSKSKKNLLYDEKNPKKEKLNIRAERTKKYQDD